MRVPPSGTEPAEWRDWLNADEHSRLARKLRAADVQRELTSRACLRQLLGHYLDRPPSSIAFALEPDGKPFLAHTSAGERLEFNVSHAGDWALLAFGHGLRVGVDIEPWSELEFDQLVRGFFSPVEKDAWAQLRAEEKRAAFFAAWTRKEAYLKALGTGLAKPLDSFAVRFTPRDSPAELLWCADDPRAPERWSMTAFTPAPGYSGALAVETAVTHVVRLTFRVAPRN